MTTQIGIIDFNIQGWTGSAWISLAGITGNNLVERTLSVPACTTDRSRIEVTAAQASGSRIVEIEAWSTSSGP